MSIGGSLAQVYCLCAEQVTQAAIACGHGVDHALFVVEALQNDALIHEAPALVGCCTPSALARAAVH